MFIGRRYVEKEMFIRCIFDLMNIPGKKPKITHNEKPKHEEKRMFMKSKSLIECEMFASF